jgi:hypothetical protein
MAQESNFNSFGFFTLEERESYRTRSLGRNTRQKQDQGPDTYSIGATFRADDAGPGPGASLVSRSKMTAVTAVTPGGSRLL